MTKISLILAVFTIIFFISGKAFTHCEIPCGIYGDKMRISMIAEDIRTIEKSMKMIVELSKEKDKNYNQLVRWITNKDLHANKIQDTVYQYFMAQRIEPAEKKDEKSYSKYIHEVTLLHQMIVYAMKSKQTTDLKNVETLRSLLDNFDKSYFAKTEKK